MLNKIVFRPNYDENFRMHTNMSSLFHGFIMENISCDYAEKMHISGLRPFTQSLVRENDKFFWQISTLDDEAFENIITKIQKVDSVYIENKDIEIGLSQEYFYQTSFDELFERNYFGNNADRFVKFEFLNPTAFKMAGKYVFMPDSTMILSGLIKKFDTFSHSVKTGDEQLLAEISEKVFIHDFHISSRNFSVDGSKIPGFCGNVTLKVNGSETLVKFVNMLADFAEFSGIGIKTALGMGAVIHKTSDQRCRH